MSITPLFILYCLQIIFTWDGFFMTPSLEPRKM